MNNELIAFGIKVAATAGTSTLAAAAAVDPVSAMNLNWLAIASALMGAFASFHFEPERKPSGIVATIVSIFSLGFSAAMLAVAIPDFPLLAWSGNIPIEARAGLLGLTVRIFFDTGRRLILAYKSNGV